MDDKIDEDGMEFLGLSPTPITNSVVLFLQLGGLIAPKMHQHTPLTPNDLEEEGVLNPDKDNNSTNSFEGEDEDVDEEYLLQKYYKDDAYIAPDNQISFILGICMRGIIPNFNQEAYKKSPFNKK